jgi:hypothetical protein
MTKEELLSNYDWRQAFAYAGDVYDYASRDGQTYGDPAVSSCIGTDTATGPVLRADVTEIVASSEGENDGPDWLIVVKVADGRYAYLTAGCDYTGWDCQAGGHCIVDNDLQHLIRFGIGEAERARLGLGLS